MLFSGAV